MTKIFVSPMRLLVVLAASSVLCLGQNDKAPTAAPEMAKSTTSTPGFSDRNPRYRLMPGDTFDLNFDLSPEFNQPAVAVQPDGYVTLRSVGDIKVSGQTVGEVRETIKTAYSKILNNPPVSVVMKDFEKPYFVADGQVAKPGKYEMHGMTTVTQAIAMAGGFQSTAKHSQVVLFRRVDDQWTEAKLINVKEMENKRDLREDLALHPGDMLWVPKNTLSKIDKLIPNMSMGAYLPIGVR